MSYQEVFINYTEQEVQCRMVLVVNFFLNQFFWLVVAIFDLVHDVEVIFHLP